MNSLRTDDILGAKPRVRHMPKDLIRQRRIPAPYFPNMPADNPEWNPHPHHYPIQPYNQKFSQIEYQNNNPNEAPFMPRHKLTKEPKYINYDMPNEPRSSQINRYLQSRIQQPQLMRAASEQRSIPERREYQRDDSARESQRPKYEEVNRSMDYQPPARNKEDQSQRRSEAKSRRSMDSRQLNSQHQTKNMFKGLGFNIITNHKYEYMFEHKKPSAY